MRKDSNDGDENKVAVIGLSCNLPKSRNHRELWKNLAASADLITTYSEADLVKIGVPISELRKANYVPRYGAIPERTGFDNEYFGYTYAEAEIMDPQIRLFHEVCVSALEDSGFLPGAECSVGLFVGASSNDYWKIYAQTIETAKTVNPLTTDLYSSANFVSSLISYKLNLTGPSIFVDTGCSSSLSAINIACQSLASGQCQVAIAGGVSIRSLENRGYIFVEGMIRSRDGYCRSFDDAATGSVPGEGAAAVVLKPFRAALEANDHIYAIVRSCVSNNDGHRKVGFTAPSVKGQIEVIDRAHKMAKILPGQISFIEAHGSATKLGDPIEFSALNSAYRSAEKHSILLSSIKSNVGHLDAASGVAGFVKAVLCLYHKFLPGTANFSKANSEFRLEDSSLYLQAQGRVWDTESNHTRFAAVHSLGIGGTNGHAILEEHNATRLPASGRRLFLVPISGRTLSSVSNHIQNCIEIASQIPGKDIDSFAYTAQLARQHHATRGFFLVRDGLSTADRKIEMSDFSKVSNDAKELVLHIKIGSPSNIGCGNFLFEPAFRNHFLSCLKAFNVVPDDYLWQSKEIFDKDFSILSAPFGVTIKSILEVAYQVAVLRFLFDMGFRKQHVFPLTFTGLIASNLYLGKVLPRVISRVFFSLYNGFDESSSIFDEYYGYQIPPSHLSLLDVIVSESQTLYQKGVNSACDIFYPENSNLSKHRYLYFSLGANAIDQSIFTESDSNDDFILMMHFVGAAWCNGFDIDWNMLYAEFRASKTSIPSYSFDHSNTFTVDVTKEIIFKHFKLGESKGFDESVSAIAKSWTYRQRPDLVSPFVSSSSDIDIALAKIYEDILLIRPIGIHDDFFVLGGDSLKAMQVLRRVYSTMGFSLTVPEFFATPTISGLTSKLLGMSSNFYRSNETFI